MFWCSVPGCTSDSRKRGIYGYMSEIKFFAYPSRLKNLKLRNRWLQQVMRKDYYNPPRQHRVCCLHFVDGRPTDSHPVPTLFPRNNFGRPWRKRGETSIMKRHDTTQNKDSSVTADVESVYCNNSDEYITFSIPAAANVEVVDSGTGDEMDHTGYKHTLENKAGCGDHRYSAISVTNPPEFRDQGVQTDLTISSISSMETKLMNDSMAKKHLRDNFTAKVVESDESIQSYTGIPSRTMLNGLFDILDKASPTLNYWSGPASSTEKPYQENSNRQKSGPPRKLSRYQEFLLTLIRLKLSLFTFCLADLFCVSKGRISQTFSTWINYMYIVFTPLLKWPSSQQIRKYLPNSFKLLYPKTTCIIDCTEMFIEKPNSPSAQATTYSTYKHRNTYKVLVAISPTGGIIFVSDLWGGNTSDRYITVESGFLNKIKPGDEVMADRGFVIRDLLLERLATLNIPPFTRPCSWGKGRRLTSTEIKKTKNIAQLRIHVERAIGRLKNFHILSGTMPLSMKPLANQIVKVCAFLCNFQKPLVK